MIKKKNQTKEAQKMSNDTLSQILVLVLGVMIFILMILLITFLILKVKISKKEKVPVKKEENNKEKNKSNTKTSITYNKSYKLFFREERNLFSFFCDFNIIISYLNNFF